MHMTNIMKRCAAAGVVFFSFANVASAAWQAGLAEGKAASSSYSATVEPTSWTAVMSPIAGGVNGWAANQVFVYRGQIYLDGAKHWFREKNWLWVWLKIDGEVLLNDDRWYVETTGSITREPGWYDFEARFWSNPDNTRGPAGLKDKNGRLCGFGYMKGDAAPTGMTDCVYPEDDGSATLFRYDDGTGFPGLNVFGDPENLGQPTPDYGLHEDVTVGTPYVLECPECATNAAETIAYRCAGWELKVNDVLVATNTDENVRTCTYVCANAADKAALTWKWAAEKYKLDVVTDGEGTVDVESQWVEPGAVFTLTATPASGRKFYKWTGAGFASGETCRSNCAVTVSEPRSVISHFYDPATTPRIIRYVTPSGAGTKDGTSWENAMSSVATAYASVGANPSGGEVWVRYGTYTVTSVSMLPDITVRGGFAGDETLAEQADPENNPTIFSNGFDGKETWADGEDTWPVWTSEGGKWWFNEPPQDGDRKMYSSFRSFGDSYAFHREDNGALGHTEFHGLTFTRYWTSAIRVKSENDDPVVFRKCRFLRLGWLTNNDRFVVQFNGTGVDMEGCEFVGLTSPIYVVTKTVDSPRRTARFKRCRISTSQECWNTSSGYSAENLQAICCGIAILRNVSLTVQDCRFDRNVSTTLGAVYANTLGDVLIENTVFSRGYTSGNENGGTLGYYWKGPDAGTFTVRNCRFERCCTKASGTSHVNQGAAIGVWGNLSGGIIRGLVENTAFIGNYTEGEGGESRGSSCVCFGSNCYLQGGYCAFTFLNCLFEGNEAIHPKNGGAGTTVGNSWTQNPRAVFANCVFKDNVCGKIDAETNMVYAAEFGREGNPYFAFVNSIFENSDENMLPWTNGKSWFCFANCVTDQPNAEFGKGSSTCYRYEPMDAGVSAGLDPDPRTNGVVVARGVAEDSVYRRKGRPIWLGTDGEVYLYDAKGDAAKPWRSCRYGGGRKTDEEAAAVGVSRSMPSIPDAFAKDRSRFKTALGQLDFGVPGMMLLVK